MTRPRKPAPGIPSADQILEFVRNAREPVGKREIAKAFGLSAQGKIALKALLKDMANDGLIEGGKGRALHQAGGLPKVTVLRVADSDGASVYAVPEQWSADTPPPRVRIIERGRRGALGIGDRLLARIEETGKGYTGHPMRKLDAAIESLIGVIAADTAPSGKPMYWLKSVDRKLRRDWPVSDVGGAAPGDLVLAELGGRPPRQMARVTQRLGDPLAPRSLSLIAIHKFGIPHVFSDEVEQEAKAASRLSLDDPVREDLTHLPIVAIDPRDARDHDDAIWAAADDDPTNPGGYRALVAIADVSFYVRPGGALDREAAKRGNSVYFPDQVVPMLPHLLSSGVCSLKAGEDRAALACHLVINRKGVLTAWRFTRARVRLAANIAYEDAQAAIDGRADHPLTETALRPLWAAWRLLAQARDAREPLDLDLPERQVRLDDMGRIAEVSVRERLDAHRLVEDYMIAANVAAAKALESRKAPVMYRVHEPPAREKLVALKEFLATLGQSFALGQVITPRLFNAMLARIDDDAERARVMEQVLRTQTQAYYAPVNAGHFGLALGSYAHFTSPIRRYADLVVHRSLVGAVGLETAVKTAGVGATTRLPPDQAAAMARLGERISAAERRAMEAERETLDRYVAAYLAEKVGDILPVRVTGIQSFGLFAQVEGLGGDAFVPLSALGDQYLTHDASAQTLSGGGEVLFRTGQRLELRLVEANPLTGGLVMAMPDADPSATRGHRAGGPRGQGRGKAGGGNRPPQKHMTGKRGRPGNIRHRSR